MEGKIFPVTGKAAFWYVVAFVVLILIPAVGLAYFTIVVPLSQKGG